MKKFNELYEEKKIEYEERTGERYRSKEKRVKPKKRY